MSATSTETLTLESIARDRWTAVRLNIPNDADGAFLDKVLDAASECQEVFHIADQIATLAGHHRSAQALADGESAAAQRVSNIIRLGMMMQIYDAAKVSDLHATVGRDLVQRVTEAPTHDPLPEGRIADYVKEARAYLSGALDPESAARALPEKPRARSANELEAVMASDIGERVTAERANDNNITHGRDR